ncbi:MAG: precorrin-2 C(20)-methyltransferase [Oscillospiraceae bacterium]|nr:precorrin-2 C(20)-methyltransferase [Oscillospiraceae bacterium]
MKGIAYGVGVGPGDPELITVKALRLIREAKVIAVPGRKAEESVAYRIADAAAGGLEDKELVAVYMPMVNDREVIEEEHRKAADKLEEYLDMGKNAVFLTEGDPSVYSTFGYLRKILEGDGYTVETVPGVTSFCAAAARLGIPLAEWDEPLHILPAAHRTQTPIDQPGTYVLMKTGRHMAEVRELLKDSGRDASAVENCGMEDEKVYRSADEIPDAAGYFSLIIAKEK